MITINTLSIIAPIFLYMFYKLSYKTDQKDKKLD